MVRILGIDPGLSHTGWGVIDVNGNALSFVASGTISTRASESMAQRISTLCSSLNKVIAMHRPEASAVEEVFVNKNAGSSLKLGHARGALIAMLSLAGLPVSEYAARQVKKTVTGVGAAEKEQVQVMVGHLLPGSKMDSADAADALAVAICHAYHAKSHALAESASV